MAKHQLGFSPETVHWGYFDAAIPPRLTIDSGDEVVIDTVSGGAGDWSGDLSILGPVHREIIEKLQPIEGPHILTGPIAIRGAEPGDTLEVKIKQIELTSDWGYNLIREKRGVLPDEFDINTQRNIPIDREAMLCKLPWVDVPLRPFFGILAVAPAAGRGRVSSVPPAEFGGNMDNKEFLAGTSVFLPVFVPGANFSTGDGHAVQGDGEMDVTALETCMKGTFEFVLHKNQPLTFPRAITPTHYIAMGVDPDLDAAAQKASHNMLDWLVELTGWKREEAYVFCSFACDLHITQAVNRSKGVHAMVRRDLIKT